MPRRLPTRAFVAAAFLLGAACSDPAAPLPRSGPPVRMDFTVGGFVAETRRVLAEGDSVMYVRRPWGGFGAVDSTWVRPTAAQWEAFWTASRTVGVQRWKPRYVAEGIVDGSGWHLEIVADGETRRSTGSNAYPDFLGREHEGEMTPEFRYFLDALGTLVGRQL